MRQRRTCDSNVAHNFLIKHKESEEGAGAGVGGGRVRWNLKAGYRLALLVPALESYRKNSLRQHQQFRKSVQKIFFLNYWATCGKPNHNPNPYPLWESLCTSHLKPPLPPPRALAGERRDVHPIVTIF